jgi:heme ABC exporter ATP-binding subunit CcmA
LASDAIEVSGLVKAYGPRLALRGLDLTLPWGSSLVLFGPNGSGKSTLIRVLATLAGPTAGHARVAGLDLRRQPGLVRGLVGVVTHQTLLYDDLTGHENLTFYGRLFGLQERQARIEALAGELGLEPHLNLRVRTLSHGIQKRFALARALLHSPRVLLLDEPEAGLDQDALALLEALLARHRRAGGSALLTTHNIERGLGMGDQVAILSQGRIVHQGARDTLDTAAFRRAYGQVTEVRD